MAGGEEFSTKRAGAPTVADPIYAGANSAGTDVRTCGRCREPALVCLDEWNHSENGTETDRYTRECRCQSCGAFVVLHDPHYIRMSRILGIVLVFTIVCAIPGLVVLLRASRRRRAWRNNPIALGASAPATRYTIGPGNRRCGSCGATAKIVKQPT